MLTRRYAEAVAIVLLTLLLFGFVSVPRGKFNVDYRQMGYDKPGLFLYRVTESDVKGKLLHTDTLGLYCSASMNGHNHMQWQIMCRRNGELVPDEKRYDGSTTENDITDSLLFIHPPRHDRYRILEFCPFPNFMNGTPHGVWTWEFAIGPIWATPPTYPIRNVDSFHIIYTSKGDVKVKTAQGMINASLVNGVSKSKYGIAKSVFVMHEKFGIVQWTAVPANGHVFQFDLVKYLPGTAAIAGNRKFAASNTEIERMKKAGSSKRTMNYMGVGGG